jgi:hypothetical protein
MCSDAVEMRRAAAPADGTAVLIAQHFPPLNIIAAQRALRMARTMLERYARIYVICLDYAGRAPSSLDMSIGRDVLEDPRLVVVTAAPLLTRHGHGVGGSAIQPLIGGLGSRLFCGPGVDWIPGLRRALMSIPAAESIRMVVASGSPFIPFVTAVSWARSRNAPIVLDYRDLWTRNPRGGYLAAARRAVNTLFERPANRSATLLTTVSDGCRAMLELDAGNTPVRTLYNAPDSAYLDYFRAVTAGAGRHEPASTAAPGSLSIVFTGMVYPACPFAPLLRAMGQLPEAAHTRITVHYYGGCSDAVRREFDAFGLGASLRDHGMVSKEESLRAIAGADVLLSLIHLERVSDDPAVTGLLTTKVYDYFLSGRPILNIGPVNAEVNQFARRIGHQAFHTMPADEQGHIASFLADAIERPLDSVPAAVVEMPDFAADFHAILAEASRIHA